MVDIKTIKPGDRIQQNYSNRRIGTVIKVFSPDGNPAGPMGVNYQLDGEDHDDSWDWPHSLDLVESKPKQPKEQPVKIQMDKQYRTRDGREVRVLCVDRNSKHPVIALINNVGINSYTETGEYYAGGTSVHDLIEYNPAQDLKLDQPIWVRNSPTGRWVPRHFAEVGGQNGVKCWDDGGTSHTCEKWRKSYWDYWTATKPE